ncbi:MAG: type III secretion system outer membrane ring subunit SctC [Pseudomonadota bacterium]
MSIFVTIPRRTIAALALGLMAMGATRAEAPPWPDAPFTYLARDQSLNKLLASFARIHAVELRATPGIAEGEPPSSGRLMAASPTDFLNQLAAIHGLIWFYESGVLHVSKSSERVTRLIRTKGFQTAGLKRTFSEMGVLEPKFGWAEIEDGAGVMVSGPPDYVERIEQAVAALPDSPPEQQVHVFRLKYAPVDDRTILYRDKQITTAGVATILRNLISGGSGNGGTSMELAEIAAPLRAGMAPAPALAEGSAPANAAADPKNDKRPPAGTARAGGAAPGARTTQQPVIQADSRLNAIIIRDKPQNATIYKQLIALLDVPSELIEIEAVIVDVNTSNMSELGIDWGARAGNVSGGFGTPSKTADGTTITLIGGKGVNPTTVIPDIGNFLMTRIKLMEGKGSARVVSRPSILTQDNLGALIDLSDTFYIQTSGERVATVTPISVGVTLRVTPRIVTDNDRRSIQLVVDIEDGSIQDVKIGTLPTVRRSTIGTQALVGEFQSLVIGGFNSEQSARQKDQVPVLGDLPALGVLFSKKLETTERRERLFLITPRIVTQASPREASASNQER